MAVRTGQCGRLPAPSPVPFWLQRVSLLRWFACTMAQHTFACATPRGLLDGIPGLRLPGSVVEPRFKPLRTSREPGGYAVTPAPGGRDLHPHEELSYEVHKHLAICPEARASFRPTGRTSTQVVLLVLLAAEHECSLPRLARQLVLSPSTLSRSLQPLVRDGLVALVQAGRRGKRVRLTPAGHHALRAAVPYWHQAQERFLRL